MRNTSGNSGAGAAFDRLPSRQRLAPHPSRRRPARRWAAVGAVAVLGGASLLGACGKAPRSADDALASAQAFVSDASAFQFDANIRATSVTAAGDGVTDGSQSDASLAPGSSGEGPGTTTIDRTTARGAWTPKAWEVTTEGSSGHSETKVFGTTGYFRDDTDGGSSQWQTSEFPSMSRQDLIDELESMRDDTSQDGAASAVTDAPGASTGLAASIYLGGQASGGPDLLSDPTGFLGAIGDMSDPQLASRDGDAVTVSAELSAPDDIEAAFGAPLPAGSMTLTIEGDGTPTRLTLSVGEGDDSVEVDLRFSDWNVPHEISRPSEGEIDRTPWIDEDAVAAVPGVTLVSPTALPSGWELDYVDVVSADDTVEACDQVNLHWSPTISGDPGADSSDDYLDVYLVPVACAMAADATPFEVGPFSPLPSRDGSHTTEVLVGDTVVQVDTTLSPSELAALVASIAPTDVGTLSAEMAAGSSVMLTS